jgi:signal recognition particle subunit SRP54
MLKGKFDLEDFLMQLQQIRGMGPLDQLLSMVPGFSQMKQFKAFVPGEEDLKRIEDAGIPIDIIFNQGANVLGLEN